MKGSHSERYNASIRAAHRICRIKERHKGKAKFNVLMADGTIKKCILFDVKFTSAHLWPSGDVIPCRNICNIIPQ